MQKLLTALRRCTTVTVSEGAVKITVHVHLSNNNVTGVQVAANDGGGIPPAKSDSDKETD